MGAWEGSVARECGWTLQWGVVEARWGGLSAIMGVTRLSAAMSVL
jgi:hypothetical protein